MNIQSIAEVLINNLNYVSVSIITIIIAIFLIAVVINFVVAAKYKKLIKELSETNFEGMEIYKGKVLNSIVSTYKETYQKSKDFVNTQAIMESKFFTLQSGLLACEKFLSTVTTMLVTLGVSGSLYGIICIATRLNVMFEQAKSLDITDMQQVYGDMSVILAFLAYAFVTTFVAIIVTFIYSLITSMTNVEILRGNFFARLEDYLDNELGSTLSTKRTDIAFNNANNGANGNINTDNSNILYMLENTSHSMMTSTSKLETTISKLNESLLEILGNDDIDLLEKKLKDNNKKEDTITLQKSKEIINKQYENKRMENKVDVNNNSNFVDPINRAVATTNVYNSTPANNITPQNAMPAQAQPANNIAPQNAMPAQAQPVNNITPQNAMPVEQNANVTQPNSNNMPQ